MFCVLLDQTTKKIKTHLSEGLTKISEWFTENFMILDPDICHYMRFGKVTVNYKNFVVKSYKLVRLKQSWK